MRQRREGLQICWEIAKDKLCQRESGGRHDAPCPRAHLGGVPASQRQRLLAQRRRAHRLHSRSRSGPLQSRTKATGQGADCTPTGALAMAAAEPAPNCVPLTEASTTGAAAARAGPLSV